MAKRKPKVNPISDDASLAKLSAAAEAAGLSLEGLADLVADSGLMALPPSDGITQRYSLQQLGERLQSCMQDMPTTKRSAWYRGLIPTQKKAIIVAMRDQGYSSEVISREFDLTPVEVNRTWAAHADELGAQVVGLRLNTIAGQVQLASERAQQMASSNEDHNGYWRIEKDKVAIWQSLGIVDQAKHKVEVTHKFDDQQKEHIDALASLEMKKLQQQEDLKQIEAEVSDTDSSPKMEDYDV